MSRSKMTQDKLRKTLDFRHSLEKPIDGLERVKKVFCYYDNVKCCIIAVRLAISSLDRM